MHVETTGLGCVEIFVQDLRQLFQSLDPSPFHDRELDDRAHAYIVQNARELSPHHLRGLVIYVDGPAVSEEDRAVVVAAVRRHFRRRAMESRREMALHFRRARASLIVALPVLALAVVGSEVVARALEVQSLRYVVRESLLIGGWVAMWHPLDLFLYGWWPIRDRRRVMERLSRLDVNILPYRSPPERQGQARLAGDHRQASQVQEKA